MNKRARRPRSGRGHRAGIRWWRLLQFGTGRRSGGAGSTRSQGRRKMPLPKGIPGLTRIQTPTPAGRRRPDQAAATCPERALTTVGSTRQAGGPGGHRSTAKLVHGTWICSNDEPAPGPAGVDQTSWPAPQRRSSPPGHSPQSTCNSNVQASATTITGYGFSAGNTEAGKAGSPATDSGEAPSASTQPRPSAVLRDTTTPAKVWRFKPASGDPSVATTRTHSFSSDALAAGDAEVGRLRRGDLTTKDIGSPSSVGERISHAAARRMAVKTTSFFRLNIA